MITPIPTNSSHCFPNLQSLYASIACILSTWVLSPSTFVLPPQAQHFHTIPLPEVTASFLLVYCPHAIPRIPCFDAFLGFSGYPPMLEAPRLSPQDFGVLLSNLNSNFLFLFRCRCFYSTNTGVDRESERDSGPFRLTLWCHSISIEWFCRCSGQGRVGFVPHNKLNDIKAPASFISAAPSPSPSLHLLRRRKSLSHCISVGTTTASHTRGAAYFRLPFLCVVCGFSPVLLVSDSSWRGEMSSLQASCKGKVPSGALIGSDPHIISQLPVS